MNKRVMRKLMSLALVLTMILSSTSLSFAIGSDEQEPGPGYGPPAFVAYVEDWATATVENISPIPEISEENDSLLAEHLGLLVFGEMGPTLYRLSKIDGFNGLNTKFSDLELGWNQRITVYNEIILPEIGFAIDIYRMTSKKIRPTLNNMQNEGDELIGLDPDKGMAFYYEDNPFQATSSGGISFYYNEEPEEAKLQSIDMTKLVLLETTKNLKAGSYDLIAMKDGYTSLEFVLRVNPNFAMLKEMNLSVGFGRPLKYANLVVNVLEMMEHSGIEFEVVFDEGSEGAFEFDEENLEIKALKIGSGSIFTTYEDTRLETKIIITQSTAEVIYDEPLYIEQGSQFLYSTGIIYGSNLEGDIEVEIDVDGVPTFVDANIYMFDTNNTFDPTIFKYRLKNDEIIQEFSREVSVVSTDKKEVSILIERSERNDRLVTGIIRGDTRNRKLAYYDHTNKRSVLLADLERIILESDMSAHEAYTQVAIDANGLIFIKGINEIMSFNPDTKEIIKWQLNSETHNMKDPEEYRSTGLAFNIENNLFIVEQHIIKEYELVKDVDNGIFELKQIGYIVLDEEYHIGDIAFDADGNLYVGSYRMMVQYDYYSNEEEDRYYNRFTKYVMNEGWQIDIDKKADESEGASNVFITGVNILNGRIIVSSSPYDLNHDYSNTSVNYQSIGASSTVLSFNLYFENPKVVSESFGLSIHNIKDTASRFNTTLEAESMNLVIGFEQNLADGTAKIKSTVTPLARNEMPRIYRIASNPLIIDLDPDGTVTAKAPGTATIEVEVDGIVKTIEVNIQEIYEELEVTLTLTPDPVEVEYGEGADPTKLTKQVIATLTNSTSNIMWQVADESIATVDENGVVTAIKEGKTTLTARLSSDSDYVSGESGSMSEISSTITVNVSYVPKEEEEEEEIVLISAENLILNIGYGHSSADGTAVIQSTVTPLSKNEMARTYRVITNPSIIGLQADGTVTAKAAGIAEVEVMVEEVSTIITVTVYSHSAPVYYDQVGITLSPNPVEIEYGEGADPNELTKQVTATLTNSTANVTWEITDETIASVDANGVVTALKTGETTLSAYIPGASAATKIIVYFIEKEEENPLGLVNFSYAYVTGYPNDLFGPKNAITRGELATMFARILNLELTGHNENTYTDVNDSQWYYDYIEAATKAGIFKGYTDDTFRPNKAVTRAELTSAIAMYWQYFNVEVDQSPQVIGDVSSTHWAKNYIYMSYNSGLVKNFEDGTFRPEDPTLREQIVSILNILIGREPSIDEASKYIDINEDNPIKGDVNAASSNVAKKSEE